MMEEEDVKSPCPWRVADDEDEEDDADMPPLEIIGPAEVLPMDDEMFERRMDALLEHAAPELLQMKNEFLRALQAKEARGAQGSKDAEELEAALRAKKTTAVLLQKLVHEPNGIDDFIAQVNRAQLALEHMKNFAKDLKVAKVLQEAQDAKEAEERHLEVLQKRAERMCKEECRVKESMFRDAGRCQGPLERNVKASLKEHAALLKEQKEHAALLKEQEALLKEQKALLEAKKTLRRHALDLLSLDAKEDEALQKPAGQLTDPDKELLRKLYGRLYKADMNRRRDLIKAQRMKKEKDDAMIELLRDDPESLQVLHAQEKALMEKPAAELSVSDMKVMQRSAERMVQEMERAIKDPDEPVINMKCFKKDLRRDKVREALEEMGVVHLGGPGPTDPAKNDPFDLSDKDLEDLRCMIHNQRATASSSSSGPAGPQSPT